MIDPRAFFELVAHALRINVPIPHLAPSTIIESERKSTKFPVILFSPERRESLRRRKTGIELFSKIKWVIYIISVIHVLSSGSHGRVVNK